MSTKRWQERIDDILQAIGEIADFLAGIDEPAFLKDKKTQRAAVANLTIIGEAARHIPDDVTQSHPEIPWELMRGMRNRIVHGYYQVDPTIVWNTCQNDLPPLIDPLLQLKASHP